MKTQLLTGNSVSINCRKVVQYIRDKQPLMPGAALKMQEGGKIFPGSLEVVEYRVFVGKAIIPKMMDEEPDSAMGVLQINLNNSPYTSRLHLTTDDTNDLDLEFFFSNGSDDNYPEIVSQCLKGFKAVEVEGIPPEIIEDLGRIVDEYYGASLGILNDLTNT